MLTSSDLLVLTRDELTDVSAADLRSLVSELGIEYTTKVDTISAILALSEEPITSEGEPEKEPVPDPVIEPKPPAPIKPVVASPGNFPTALYESRGIEIGKDGDRVRYDLQGNRLN